ncbi:hypothetical protein MTO96_022369, partial [Rhipicephalus appendiculatus]
MTVGEDADPSLLVTSHRGDSPGLTVVEETDQSLVGASRRPSSSTQTEASTKSSIKRRKVLPAAKKRTSIAESADVAADQCTPAISAIPQVPLTFVPVTSTDSVPEAPVLASQQIDKEDLTAPAPLPAPQATAAEVRTLMATMSEGEAQGPLPKPESGKTAAYYSTHDVVTTLSAAVPSRKSSRGLLGLMD